MIFRIVLILVSLSSPALAQQQNQMEQRIASQIGSLVIQNTAQAAQIEQLNAELGKAQARIKELESKPSAPGESKVRK